MVDWLVGQGIEGATVLEIGGGVGAIQIDLLTRGAERTTNLELSTSYETDAARLSEEAGLADRVDRRIGDIAADGSVADPADAVVLHRVVCCYPDLDRLLGSAADHAQRTMVFSHPPQNAASRAVSALVNLTQRLLRSGYRSFVHGPQDMLDLLRNRGFNAEHLYRGLIWEIVVATRS